MLNPLGVAAKAFEIGAGLAAGAVKTVRGVVGGQAPEADRRPPKPGITDTALARKVESILFSDPAVPKGKIDVNAVGRDVYLRGEAKSPEMISELERRANAIPEVAKVENLLHLPGAPAPTRADTPKSAQASRRTKGTAPARKRAPKKVNAEAAAKPAEAPPVEPGEDVGA